MKTYVPKKEDFDSKTYLIDASGKTLGRLATKVASLLLGKEKASFAYDQLSGDQVVVVNASKVHVTGNKKEQKVYNHYSGFPSGLKTYNFETLIEKKPEEVITRAVKGMLPKKSLGSQMLRRLRVYAGAEHKQQAQKPVTVEI